MLCLISLLLLRQYALTFLIMKQSHSGWPNNNSTWFALVGKRRKMKKNEGKEREPRVDTSELHSAYCSAHHSLTWEGQTGWALKRWQGTVSRRQCLNLKVLFQYFLAIILHCRTSYGPPFQNTVESNWQHLCQFWQDWEATQQSGGEGFFKHGKSMLWSLLLLFF